MPKVLEQPAVAANLTTALEGMKGALDSLGTNVFVADLDLRLVYMNRRATETMQSIAATVEKLFGIPMEELIGTKIDSFHGDRAKQIRRMLENPKNLPIRKEIQLAHLVLDLNVNAILDENGEYIGLVVNWEEISELRRLREDMGGQVAAISKAQAVIEFNMDGTIRTANENFQRALGYSLDEIKGKHHSMFVEAAYASSPAYKEFWAKLNRGEYDAGEYKRVGKGGKEVWIQASYNPIVDANGKPWKVVKYATDITEQKDVIRQVKHAAAMLGSSAEELTATSQQMANGAEETAEQANSVSAASEEVSKSVSLVATGSDEMLSAIREIARSSNEAARVAKDAVSVADEANTTISKLGDSSTEIGKVIKVITSIAQQTNLLALNATIEAARAGEAGKGFAVVANEVKELAKQTAKATEEIGQKIEAIQRDTKGAVDSISTISTVIAQINDISGTIASAVEEQTATTTQIGRNVGEAAKGTGDIAKNISRVASAAKQTTQGAGETEKAAKALSELASSLQSLVARFQV